jgi:DHA1 family multidrug resistance protein-like MFS transporter
MIKTYILYKKYPVLFILALGTFFMNTSSHLIVPYIGYYFVTQLNISLYLVGLALTLSGFIQYSGSVFGGLFSEKFGNKTALIFGIFIRFLGYLLLYLGNPYIKIISLIVIALGMIFYQPSSKSIITNIVINSKRRAVVFSLQNSLGNAGVIIGPIIGSIFIFYNINIILISVPILCLIIGFFYYIFIPSYKTKKQSNLLKNMFINLYSNKHLQTLLLINLLIFFIFIAFLNYLGIFIGTNLNIKLLPYILTINALIIIFIGPFLSTLINKINLQKITLYGFFAFGLGNLLFYFSNFYTFLIGSSCIAVAEILFFIKLDLELAKILPNSIAVGVGLLRLFAGIGVALSGIFSSFLYKTLYDYNNAEFFWLIFSIISFFFLIFTNILIKKQIPSKQ